MSYSQWRLKMLRIVLSCAAISGVLMLASCHNDNSDQKTAQISGKVSSKPIVSVVPIVDSTQNDVPWNLSDELTALVQYRLSQKNKLFLIDLPKVRAQAKKIKDNYNPFGPDLSWAKSVFPNDEYVVFMELIEHEELYLNDRKKPVNTKDCAAELNLGMRIRVIDLRGENPKVVLQELVRDSQFLPKQFTSTNFYQIPWGKENFTTTPLGLAHVEFTKDIASRIEDYILLADKN